jgi:outer membrane lipoprotein-sorting protein
MSANRRGVLAAMFLPFAAPALCAEAVSSTLSSEDRASIEAARTYLRGLSSAIGRFVQTDPRGEVSTGTFYLQRPGKARWEYDPPSALVMTSNGFRVEVANRKLKTLQAYPLGATPLGILLSRDIRIDKGVDVGAVVRRAEGFSVIARDRARRGAGEIALDFTEKPLALAGWTISAPQAGATRVRLLDFAPSGRFPASLFELGDPETAAGARG